MYEDFYHLSAKPFRLSPDPSFFFASRGHKRALAYLRYGLNQGEGFVVITGEPGTGKTTLAQILLSEMDKNRMVVAHLTTTQLEADDMLRMVAASFGLRYESVDKAALLKTLEAFLIARSRERKRALLVVDEAQNLPARSLEELRMLSNLQVGDQALLQTFLLGQVQFRKMLDHPDLEQLRQRVIANYHLSALAQDECQSYVESRLKHVGWNHDPEFTPDAYEIIFNHTSGIPRRINMLCDRVLLFSCLEEQHVISKKILDMVTDELQSEISGKPIRPADLLVEDGSDFPVEDVIANDSLSQAHHESAARVSDSAIRSGQNIRMPADIPAPIVATTQTHTQTNKEPRTTPENVPASHASVSAQEDNQKGNAQYRSIVARADDSESGQRRNGETVTHSGQSSDNQDVQQKVTQSDIVRSKTVAQAKHMGFEESVHEISIDESHDEVPASATENLQEKDRFRVISGGKVKARRQRSASTPAQDMGRGAAQGSSPAVLAPIPDMPGDSDEVSLRKVLRLVLAYHRSPRSFPGLDDLSSPIPNGMHALLELAADDDSVITNMRQIAAMSISPAMLRAAVRYFIRRVLFVPGADDFRVLGLDKHASMAAIEQHYGFMMKLMRMDKQDEDESSVARIGQSYENLCRKDIRHDRQAPAVSHAEITDIEIDQSDEIDMDLDLDLSPNSVVEKVVGRRIAPEGNTENANALIDSLGRKEATGPTSRNVMLLLAAALIIIFVYIFQIRDASQQVEIDTTESMPLEIDQSGSESSPPEPVDGDGQATIQNVTGVNDNNKSGSINRNTTGSNELQERK